MFKVSYKVNIGSSIFASDRGSFLISLETMSGLYVPVNSCFIVLRFSKDITVKTGDTLSVEIGYDNDLKKVFTGTVYNARIGIEFIRVHALGAFVGLTTTYCNLMYEQSTAGTIIKDLFTRAGVAPGKVDPGMTLAVYGISDNYSLYDEVKKLAFYNGFDLFADKEDKAQCKTFIPGNPLMYGYGSNIISFTSSACTAVSTAAGVYGESPVGQGQGDDAVSWLTKKDVKGEDGDTTGYTRTIFEPGARNTNNANLIARSIMAEAKKAEYANAAVLGDAELELTGCILISGMPDSSLNAVYKIRGVYHKLNPVKGFVSYIDMEKIV